MKTSIKINLDGGYSVTGNYELGMPVNKLTDAKNIDLGFPGLVKKRKGLSLFPDPYGTVGAYTILGMGELLTSGGTYIPVIGSNQGKLFRMDSLDGTWDDISRTAYATAAGTQWNFAPVFGGYILCCDGTNVEKYNGSGNATAVTSPPSGAKYPLGMWGFAWLANASSYESYLYYSAYQNADSWNTTTWMLPIDPNDGSVITGIAKGEKAIYIWKNHSLHGLYWTNTLVTAPTFRRQRLFDVGCCAHKAIQRTPYGFVWYDGVKVWLWDEENYPVEISADIREDLKLIVKGRITQATSLWLEDRNQYMLSVPYGSGATLNNRVYVCTLGQEAPKWAYYDWPAGHMANWHTSATEQYPYIAASAATGYAYKALDTELDIDAAIKSVGKSKWFSAKDFNISEYDEAQLQLDFIRLVVAAEGNWDMRCGFELDFGKNGGQMFPVNQFAGGDLIGSTFIIGTSLIGGGDSDITAERYFRGVNFEHLRLVVENSYADQPFTIKSIEIGVKTKQGVK